MAREKRQHDPEFKAKIAIEAIRGRYAIKEIAAIFNLNPSLVHAWKQQLQSMATQLFKPAAAEGAAACERQLERKIRELTAEQEWMRRAMHAMTLRDKRACVEAEDPDISILAQSRLLGLHRSGIYYKNRERAAAMPSSPSAAANSCIASGAAYEGESHER